MVTKQVDCFSFFLLLHHRFYLSSLFYAYSKPSNLAVSLAKVTSFDLQQHRQLQRKFSGWNWTHDLPLQPPPIDPIYLCRHAALVRLHRGLPECSSTRLGLASGLHELRLLVWRLHRLTSRAGSPQSEPGSDSASPGVRLEAWANQSTQTR